MSSRLKIHFIPVWKEAPFLRLLVPLMLGIIFQWYVVLPYKILAVSSILSLLLCVLFYLGRRKTNYQFGASFYILLMIAGCWLVLLKDARNWQSHISKHYYDHETVMATLQEPLAAKSKSYKAEASIQLLDSAGNLTAVTGNIIVYFSKDTLLPVLDYGSTIIFKQSLIPIKNAGNPGGFDYKRYAAFNGLYYQVFLKTGDYKIAPYKTYNRFKKLLFTTRSFVIKTFKKFIPGNIESGMAEALLVGYKEDLDKSLVEQYANTGVVHIIAISGMHLGLIYGLLFVLLKPLRRKKSGIILHALIIIAALWFFSLLTGAAPSITRSAIMFTVIVSGNSFSKKTTIFNSLAISAFLLLLVNPFNLWDVGFQLSYAALLSIAVLGKPVSNWWKPDNILLRKLWQLIAVTLAAQVFTLPLVLFHFHQFPVSFLLANIVAVPLSSLILYVLLALLFCSWIPFVSVLFGLCASWLIKFMNTYVGWVNAIPFSKISEVYYSIPQAIILVLLLVSFCWWLLHRNTTALISCLSFLLLLVLLKQIDFHQTSTQRKLVVYNVPQKSAIDIFDGRSYSFYGDTALKRKDFLQNFHLLPARILYQATFKKNILSDSNKINKIYFGKYSMLVLDKPFDLKQSANNTADFLFVNKNCRSKPFDILNHFHCSTIVLDGTNNNRRILQWKNAADSLHLRLHSVQEQGAFIIDF